jgi:hypothetical protein
MPITRERLTKDGKKEVMCNMWPYGIDHKDILSAKAKYKLDSSLFIKRKLSLIHDPNHITFIGQNFIINPESTERYFNRLKRPSIDSVLTIAATGVFKGIYVIYMGEGNKYYIGSTSADNRSFSDRWYKHYRDLLNERHHCHRAQKAFNNTKIFLPMIYKAYSSLIKAKDIKRKVLDEEAWIKKLTWNNTYNTQ